MSDALELAEAALAQAEATVAATQAVVDALSDQPEPPEPPDTRTLVLHGSSSEIEAPNNTAEKAFSALEASLQAAAGTTEPVLMFDHRYDGDTISASIPSWWAGKGLRFGMMNGKGPCNPTSTAFRNLEPLARSLPAGFTLYQFWWHEPEDNFPAKQWTDAFAGFVAAVKAIPSSAFKSGASIVPGFNLHGSMFRQGSMFEKWGPLDSWNPYAKIPQADWPLVLATINGYADPGSTTLGDGEDPEWAFRPGFDRMRGWGATRLGIGEWGVQPANVQAAYVRNAGQWLEDEGDVEVAAYFSSGVGGNAGTEGWELKSTEAKAAYADVCLNGRRE
jgi:hypothetical protein